MSYAANLWIFFILLFGIIIVPGMDMLFVIANSLTGGLRAGFSATAGIMTGGAVHAVFGLLLVSLLTSVSPHVFRPLVILGALYMGWIGYTLVRNSIRIGSINEKPSGSVMKAFRQGTVTCLLNPKAYIFIMAVYPQFMKPEFGSMVMQGIVMGVMTVLTQGVIYGSLAIGADRVRTALFANPKAIIIVGHIIGVAFMIIAVYALWQGLVEKS
jgi:threonine/homoserine/homoserine lactone efflux protein